MTDRDATERAAAQKACNQLLQSRGTLQMATKTASGEAEASYAPFLRDGNDLCIYVSELASHTANMLRDNRVSIMVIEDEQEARNPFARKRLILICKAQVITPQSPRYEGILQGLQDKFGDTIGMLRQLPDFHLLILSPKEGRFVQGFGLAWTVNGHFEVGVRLGGSRSPSDTPST